MAWNVGRKREKKIVNKPMEVKQYGASSATKNPSKEDKFKKGVEAFLSTDTGKKVQKVVNAVTSDDGAKTETKQKKPASERYKEISERAASKRTAEQNAAIEKNNNRLYWKNKERMNNSGSYKAMMQSRTKGEMQRAAKNNAKTPLSGDSDLYKSQQRKKTEDARRRAMEKAFGR